MFVFLWLFICFLLCLKLGQCYILDNPLKNLIYQQLVRLDIYFWFCFCFLKETVGAVLRWKKKERETHKKFREKIFYGLGFSCVRVYGTDKNNLGLSWAKSMFQNEVLHPPNDLVCKKPLLFVYTSSGSINIKKACPKCGLFCMGHSSWKCYLLAEHN